ncbi:DUF2332 domain-containing protein [Consotaella aegiceratis]|uniref:DUF2332 domain-containing protein n=1 Tax=Consotaella aegiceratis TaxID=3097961 RepID=UPI002F3E950C
MSRDGAIPTSILEQFTRQVEACEHLGSPFTARLCRLLPDLIDDTTLTGRAVRDWTHDGLAAMPLRLTGALHRLVLAGADTGLAAVYPPNEATDAELSEAMRAALAGHDAEIRRWLDSPPQTNEVARAAGLLPGLLVATRETGLPLALFEIGSSAGLNLSLDAFRYTYGNRSWGDPDSAVHLQPELRGAEPDLTGSLRIAARRGCDRSPIRIENADERLRLRGYVWADQPARLARLDAALALARGVDATVERCDAADFARLVLADPRPGVTTCLFHSIVWQYLPEATKNDIETAVHGAGRIASPEAPIVWLTMEPDRNGPGAALLLELWPGGERRQLGRMDFHGRWLDWRA